jgi:hypothetical protein
MRSASQCHACGRCSGHRDAVTLKARAPNREILDATPRDIGTPAALLLLFGMLGLALGAFQWTSSPWFVALRQWAVEWLVDHDAFALLESNAPWWLLTHYPEAGDVLTWLDGIAVVAYVGGYALLAGGLSWLALLAAARLARDEQLDWRVLSLGLLPLAGAGLFLGLTMTTLTQLRAEGWLPPGVPVLRTLILAGALVWSGWLGARLLARSGVALHRRMAALMLYLVPLSIATANWHLLFEVW